MWVWKRLEGVCKWRFVGVEISFSDTIFEDDIFVVNVLVAGWWWWECGWWREGGAVAEILEGEGEMRREELEEVHMKSDEHFLRVFDCICVFFHHF